MFNKDGDENICQMLSNVPICMHQLSINDWIIQTNNMTEGLCDFPSPRLLLGGQLHMKDVLATLNFVEHIMVSLDHSRTKVSRAQVALYPKEKYM